MSLYPQGSMDGVIGRVLGGRYRIAGFLGAGRFTEVYLAVDLSESRRAVVKLLSQDVLPDGWAGDRILADRFREAAEEASSVNHPHVGKVYDWGDSGYGLYTVAQYLEGGSLREMLDRGYRLTPSQALMVGLEVTRGLDHIHGQGIIHRDIRPSNIRFDRRGRACLTDLGTSWVLMSSEAAGTLMPRSVFSGVDAVRYASPEQAQGLNLDQKSDVYSLVLVLTEALTGRVPFEADHPEDTQIAKMSRQLDLAGQFGRLGRVLEGVGRPERDDRPSARGLGTGLLSAAKTLSRPEPLPLAESEREVVQPAPAEPVTVDPAPRTPSRRGAPAVGASPGPPAPRRLLWGLIVVLLLGAAGFGLYKLWDDRFGSAGEPVPNLSGATEADLARLESEFGWVLDHQQRRQDGTVAGDVLEQTPSPGTRLEQGETVTVWVSLGPRLVAIPGGLVGTPLVDAEARLLEVGLRLGEVTERHDETVIAGAVVEVDELFADLDPGASVDLVVSLGPEIRSVPAIEVGTTLAVARERLEEAGLEVLEWRVPDNVVEEGRVVRLEPPPGTEVDAGTVVSVAISDGPEPVRIPGLATLGVEEAAEILEEVGLCAGSVDGPPDTEILTSTPPADAIVDHGTCVGFITRPLDPVEDEEEGEEQEG